MRRTKVLKKKARPLEKRSFGATLALVAFFRKREKKSSPLTGESLCSTPVFLRIMLGLY